MANGFFAIPYPDNEPVYSYAPGSPEKKALKLALKQCKSKTVDLPMYINGEWVSTDTKVAIHPPHELKHTLGHFNRGSKQHVQQAIDAALNAKDAWENMPWYDRAAIFLKAADMLAGPYRYKINAATMLCQSKNAYQAEIDSACELIDFLRFNAYYLNDIYAVQPDSSAGIWNRMEYRPLEGFVLAITPFNFTAIAGNLPISPALMGNTVVWKPADSQIYAASVIMEVLHEAGLPAGVINLVFTKGPDTGGVAFAHPDFAGVHFTGSTGTFQYMWKTIGENIASYKSYPRIVGETGGKDFIIAHKSAKPEQLSTAIVRGAFEFQGQKCSAASRVYMPSNLWPTCKKYILDDLATINVGTVEDFTNFVNAVIDEKAFNNITAYIDQAKQDEDVEILAGGTYSKEEGYFIDPTVLLVKDPKYRTMQEEIFGPVITIYVYDENEFDAALDLVNTTSPYALTGSVFARQREIITHAANKLRHAAGNFYINDKPTGAVVNQQPFGGGRASGTNDKAGSHLNLLRWVSVRSIKETFVPSTDYRYPFLGEV